MLSEKLLIWNEIKKAAPAIMRAGGNAVEILIWSQGKTLEEVRQVLGCGAIIKTLEPKEIHEVSVNDIEESQEAKSKPSKSIICDEHEEDQKLYEMIEIENMETTKKIQEMVEFEENNPTENEKAVLGLVEDE